MNQIIQQTIDVLRKGGTILYPTDTIWGIGCDATNQKAVDKVYQIKNRELQKSFIILVSSVEMLADYVNEIPTIAFDIIDSVSEPLTIIYPHAKNLSKNVIAQDGSIAIRIVKECFCHNLIKEFNKPLVSTSANLAGEPSPVTFSTISEIIQESVDFIVPIENKQIKQTKPSKIIKLGGNTEFEIIRS